MDIKQNLYFNLLTFGYPEEKLVFYFSAYMIGRCFRIHKTLFPNNIDFIYPDIYDNETEFIYTTFAYPNEGFKQLQIDLKTENEDFVKRYYNEQIYRYFKRERLQIARRGFVNETIVL